MKLNLSCVPTFQSFPLSYPVQFIKFNPSHSFLLEKQTIIDDAVVLCVLSGVECTIYRNLSKVNLINALKHSQAPSWEEAISVKILEGQIC